MKKRSLITDLTPLLDVILIILFMVLVSGREKDMMRTEDLERSNRVLQVKVAELEKVKSPVMDTEKNWYIVYNSQIGKAELNFPDDIKTGKFRLIKGEGNESIKPETEEFEKWVVEEIKSMPQEVIIVTFRYKDSSIYYRDYTIIRDLLTGLSEKTGKKVVYEETPS